MAEIDVLVPVYNAEATLSSAVDSLTRQTIHDIRLILVNDGSTDRTPDILDDIASADHRILVINQPNGGLVSALNRGIEAVDAPFVARMDADDICDPHRFALQTSYFNANPDCVAVSGAVQHIDANGTPIGERTTFHDTLDADPLWAPSKEPHLIHPFLMMRTSALRQVNGYRNAYFAEDADLYWRLAEIGRLANLPDQLGQYRIHADSISGRSVLNGRVMAYGSQLAAISARRRRSGQPDLAFSSEGVSAYKAAKSLAGMFELASTVLSPGEATWLRVAVSVKMLELASYRPYELESDDLDFISEGWRDHSMLSRRNRREFAAFYARTIVDMTRKRRFSEARTLLNLDLVLPSSLRLAKYALSRWISRCDE
jgi:glycosyltransferase involved in cell wall biosynthesis